MYTCTCGSEMKFADSTPEDGVVTRTYICVNCGEWLMEKEKPNGNKIIERM